MKWARVLVAIGAVALVGQAQAAVKITLLAHYRAAPHFTLRQARTVDLASERAYWRGYRVKIAVPRCWWDARGRFAGCQVLTTGVFTNLGIVQTVSGVDEVGYRHHRVEAWTP